MAASSPVEAARGQNQITEALGRLFALSEAYPDLKANANFRDLQEELTSTEDKVAYSRQFYNDTVFRYNTKIQAFPSVIFANMLGFKKREFFQADDDSRGPVSVKF
jgi:LemA protein